MQEVVLTIGGVTVGNGVYCSTDDDERRAQALVAEVQTRHRAERLLELLGARRSLDVLGVTLGPVALLILARWS